jgi:hypothetical protein
VSCIILIPARIDGRLERSGDENPSRHTTRICAYDYDNPVLVRLAEILQAPPGGGTSAGGGTWAVAVAEFKETEVIPP